MNKYGPNNTKLQAAPANVDHINRLNSRRLPLGMSAAKNPSAKAAAG